MASVFPSLILSHGMELVHAVQIEVCLFIVAGLIYVLVSAGVATKKVPKSTVCISQATPEPKIGVTPLPQAQKPSATSFSRADRAKIIRDYGKENRLDAAVTYFENMKQSGFGVDPLFYNSVLEAAVQCSDMPTALKYLAEAVACNCADAVSYNTVIKGHLAAENTQAAWDIVNDMKEKGVAANHRTYHSILHSTVSPKNRDMAWECVAHMQDANLKPTTITCTIIFKLVSAGGFESDMTRAMALADALEEPIDEAMFTSLVEACLVTKRLDLLTAKLRSSKATNNCPKLCAPVYGAMIRAYGQNHEVNQIWLLWNEMIDCKVQPTNITLGCMVEALVMNESVDSAWQLVQDLWEKDVHRHLINNVVYSTILKGFAMCRQMDKVLACYDVMRERNIECNTITYNTLLNALVRCKEVNRVPQILEDMHTASPKIEADAITYSTVMKAYCSSGELDKALGLLKTIEDSGLCTPDEVMFNSLLEGCAKQQRLTDAMSLMDKMSAASVVPSNYTLSIMVKLLGRVKRLDQAFRLVDQMSSKHNFRPNIFVYTCLIQACFHNKQVDRALQLHNQIVKEGCLFDEKAYVCLAQGCIRAGAVEKALAVVRCAFGLANANLVVAAGRSPGVDAACLEEVCSKVRSSSMRRGAELVQQLLADVESERNKRISRPSAAAPWHRDR